MENEGCTFQLTNDGNNFNCDVDTVRDFKGKDPMMIMRAVLGLRSEILELLRTERVLH